MFSQGKLKDDPLYVGSIKTNIGHLEAASGVLSVIKATMMLERGFILPNCDWQKFPESIPVDLGLKVSRSPAFCSAVNS